ncbi:MULTISPECIES: AMP-binding protein [unclassified Sporosarcina]|uniref:AMP-binding protein n=1 Tax=unclassified Sporosarcina TaxID=2647733 RepID=UPI00203CCF19|nr:MULTISPECIES: AMP-binding protein [unclassified Sporosarcina]GKV64726.1 long-chain-fatty-acid--CoA ligase [Sporosarcina sp. NCCP-2331]GLB54836.1 long-chain-fatty-acid--CoA ligase [Sporosarcina sp. NCCP-2378]
MQKTVRPYWPSTVPEKLTYRLGEIPLHEYVKHNAQEQSEKTAFQFYGNAISWQELDDQIDRLAQFFVTQNFVKGERIALFMQNCPQYIIGHYAIQRMGGIVVPLNPMYREAELVYLIQEADIKGIIAGQEIYSRIEKIADEVPGLHCKITTNYIDYVPAQPDLPFPQEYNLPKERADGTFDFISIIQENEPLASYPPTNIWEDVALLVFTSGTTGRPKGAMLTHGNALYKTAAAVAGNEMMQEETLLSIAPLSHIAGMLMGVNIPVYHACQTILMTRFDPAATVLAIEKYRVTTWYSIAIMNWAIMQLPGVEKRDFSSLKKNLSTSFGLQVTKELADQWKAVTKGCPMYEAAYGLSETHTGDTFMPQENVKYGSCGIAVNETEIKIIDPATGEEMPAGKEGEVIIRGPGVFTGYLNRPEATEETLREGWLHTGDFGKLDEEGYLYYLGRIKELIKCSGYSVFPDDVEALLSNHSAVSQSVAIGVPDTKRGENVKAFIILKQEFKGKIEPQEIIDWAKENMAAYKYPREVEFIEELPTTSSGKILRRLLKEEGDRQ